MVAVQTAAIVIAIVVMEFNAAHVIPAKIVARDAVTVGIGQLCEKMWLQQPRNNDHAFDCCCSCCFVAWELREL